MNGYYSIFELPDRKNLKSFPLFFTEMIPRFFRDKFCSSIQWRLTSQINLRLIPFLL